LAAYLGSPGIKEKRGRKRGSYVETGRARGGTTHTRNQQDAEGDQRLEREGEQL